MPTHAETKSLPYSAQQMFDLVLDVDRYPEFLPWCLSAKVWKREEGVIYADLVIGYGVIKERFTSRVSFTSPSHIHVEYLKGPMKHLSNHWRFTPNGDGGRFTPNGDGGRFTPEGDAERKNPASDGCEVDFFVDFEFKNPVLRKLMGVFFNEAVRVMVKAFEARADELYSARG